jgi:hypothetical protein
MGSYRSLDSSKAKVSAVAAVFTNSCPEYLAIRPRPQSFRLSSFVASDSSRRAVPVTMLSYCRIQYTCTVRFFGTRARLMVRFTG